MGSQLPISDQGLPIPESFTQLSSAKDLSLTLEASPVPLRDDGHGRLRVGPTRVTLETASWSDAADLRGRTVLQTVRLSRTVSKTVLQNPANQLCRTTRAPPSHPGGTRPGAYPAGHRRPARGFQGGSAPTAARLRPLRLPALAGPALSPAPVMACARFGRSAHLLNRRSRVAVS